MSAMKLNINDTLYDVTSLEDASRQWTEIRDRLGLGSSDMWRNCSEVRDAAGKLVARISYNGRIWPSRRTAR